MTVDGKPQRTEGKMLQKSTVWQSFLSHWLLVTLLLYLCGKLETLRVITVSCTALFPNNQNPEAADGSHFLEKLSVARKH